VGCLDHICRVCGYAWIDNQRAYACPECGGSVTNDFDEPLDDWRDEYDRYEDEDDWFSDEWGV